MSRNDRVVERRYLAQPVELRAAASGPGTLFGYAAKYNTFSQNLGGFVETIAPGAFDKSLADHVRVMCRYNHDDAGLLGTTDAGTLTVASDAVGLIYEDNLPDTGTGRDVAVLAARGDVRFSSFAFECITDEWDVTPQGFPLRTLTGVRLIDVAPVNNPAYLDTTTAKRSLEAFMTEHRNVAPDAEAKLSALLALLAQLAAADAALDPIADAITGADAALDAAQATISQILGVPNPDADAAADTTSGVVQANANPVIPESRETHSSVAVQQRLLALDALR